MPPRWLPSALNWANYTSPWEQLPLARFFLNSTIVTSLAVLGAVLSSAFVAYGFARFDVRGRDFLFLFVLGTMMIPDAVTLIPRFILFSRLKWVDTYLPLTVPFYFGSSFFIFLFRQFFISVPRELDDAARIDGCSYPGVFLRIILPLSKPALLTAAIFSFLWNWNDFLNPLIYLHSLEKFTAAIGLLFFQGQHYAEWGQVMAVSTLMTLPVIVLFLILQRYYVEGIALTGLKG
jgi:multiple sugar transport system permease protein